MASHEAEKRRRVYQQWQGNETFFCWGHLVAGPNWRASLGTAFLLLAPAGIFIAFVAPYVMRELHVVIMVFSVILPVLCGFYLFLTACRDPGIVPRQEPDDEYLAGRKPRTQEVTVNGQRVVIRYNDTCHFYQPPRAHHCSVNDNCIERFDHHCPWVGTTIGKRNYRTFLLFVYSATVLCLYVIGVCLAMLFLKHNELVRNDQAAGGNGEGKWGATFRNVIPALVLMAYTFIFVWFVGGLSGFHAYLVATNQTTYENFRYNHDNRPNPFDRGIWQNCAEVWCSKLPPSQVHFRAFVDPPARSARNSVDNRTSVENRNSMTHALEDMEMTEVHQGYVYNPTAAPAPQHASQHVAISMQDQQQADDASYYKPPSQAGPSSIVHHSADSNIVNSSHSNAMAISSTSNAMAISSTSNAMAMSSTSNATHMNGNITHVQSPLWPAAPSSSYNGGVPRGGVASSWGRADSGTSYLSGNNNQAQAVQPGFRAKPTQ